MSTENAVILKLYIGNGQITDFQEMNGDFRETV